MHAIVAPSPGGPDVLLWEALPTPKPGPDQLLVRVEAAGVNFIDTYQRSGAYKVDWPLRLGQEGAGVVEAIGDSVQGASIGQRVAWTGVQGSYATHVLVPAATAVPVPDGLDATAAAAAMLQGMTAHYLAHDTFKLAPGHVCVVHAAAGGVGLLLCQFAKQQGAYVIGTTSTETKARAVRELGADKVMLYARQDFVSETRWLTNEQGAHVVYDSIGKDTFSRSLDTLRRRGMLVLYGQSSGAVPPFDPQILNAKGSLFLTRPSLGHYIATREELLARASSVFSAVQQGKLKLTIDRVLPMHEAAEAHRVLEARATSGKILLRPA